MEEIDADEYCAMMEEEARKKNPDEEYQMDAAYRLGLIREEIDKLEVFIDDLISKIRQQKNDTPEKDKRHRRKRPIT